jgi:hypothetical protein
MSKAWPRFRWRRRPTSRVRPKEAMSPIGSYEDHEIRAWRDFARAAGLKMLTSDGSGSWDRDLFVTASPRCAVSPFNRALGIGSRSPATVKAIAQVMAWYEDCGVSPYWLQLSAAAPPRSVETWLLGHQFAYSHASALLACRPAGNFRCPPSSLEVRPIGEESARVFGRVVAEAYGWPVAAEELARCVVGRDGWHHYLAYDGPAVVGCGAAYYADGLAWIGFGGVVATHRRRGCQALMISRRIADARRFCRTVIVDTAVGSSSYRNCLRLGFEHVASRPVYGFPRPGPGSIRSRVSSPAPLSRILRRTGL